MNAEKEKILIVDDVEVNRAILEEIIKSMGVEPLLAENGEQAFELAEKWRPQLILTDISMPGMDGYELCRLLKKNKGTKNIPVIFISALEQPEDILEGFTLGGEDYITKPFIAEVVRARVGVRLRLHEATRELREMNRRLQISVSEQLRQIELEKKNILYAMANIAAENADYEKEHVERLGRNCRVLAQAMQLSPLFEARISDTYVEIIELAAPLCDIGNIEISRELLRKKEGLTAEEAAQLQNHTRLGAKLLKDIYANSDYNDFISISVDIIQYHHENWDGSGYPDGLTGERIPLGAQIVSIMERFCELTEKGGCPKEEALEIMGGEAGTKFNPDIYKICCKISRQLC
ncbi:MAG: response regulator [Lachnospiraceae bacterium]|nr:response regulator [Lachnospiraceae bacterium]